MHSTRVILSVLLEAQCLHREIIRDGISLGVGLINIRLMATATKLYSLYFLPATNLLSFKWLKWYTKIYYHNTTGDLVTSCIICYFIAMSTFS